MVDDKITITSLAADAASIGGVIEYVSLLGRPQKIQFTRDASEL